MKPCRIPKLKIGDVVLFKWADHYYDYKTGWTGVDELETSHIFIETCGFVIGEDKDYVYVSPSFEKSDQYFNGGHGGKLKACIVEFKILRKA